MRRWGERRGVHLRPFGLLIVHVACTAIVFASLFTIGWLVAVFFNYLNSIQKFPSQLYTIIESLEVWLFYADCLLSGIVLLASVFRFVKDILEGD